jgi:hypothetical protein
MKKAQTILEFTAGMIVLCLIIYGLVAIFRWGMMDMAERRYDHDRILSNSSLSVEEQLKLDFHHVRPMDATVFRK